ncbi:MAG: BMP family ABC transporter substrate-binding protein [Candidatus Riflebacteria bacterium]|nr:BMP family ABC transporter substrate-binding protein [Candidatus Riflebacteria bacterium]
MRSTVRLTALLGLVAVLGCGGRPGDKGGDKGNLPRVALVLSVGGLGDKSFNDSAHEGLMRAGRELPVKVFEGQPTMMAEDERYLRTYAGRGFDLIIAVGFLMKSATVKVARDYPGIRFAIIDADVDPVKENPNKNIASLRFKEHEGSFLVGAAAALASKTGIVGFVGGMDIPLIHKFELGYTEGAKHVDPAASVLVQYAGSGPEAFSDPVKGKQLAEGMFSRGADVIFHASGSTGNGVIEAARAQGKLAIGVDANQDGDAPGFVLTSMIKRVDVAVFNAIKETLDRRYRGEPHHYGLVEGAVSTTDFSCMKDPVKAKGRMDPERLARILTTLDKIKQEIVAGKIKVSNYEESH